MKYTYESKQGRSWEVTYETTDESYIWERLAHELIAKKLHKCTYIYSIEDHNNYDGTRTITMRYAHNDTVDGRGTYIVKN